MKNNNSTPEVRIHIKTVNIKGVKQNEVGFTSNEPEYRFFWRASQKQNALDVKYGQVVLAELARRVDEGTWVGTTDPSGWLWDGEMDKLIDVVADQRFANGEIPWEQLAETKSIAKQEFKDMTNEYLEIGLASMAALRLKKSDGGWTYRTGNFLQSDAESFGKVHIQDVCGFEDFTSALTLAPDHYLQMVIGAGIGIMLEWARSEVINSHRERAIQVEIDKLFQALMDNKLATIGSAGGEPLSEVWAKGGKFFHNSNAMPVLVTNFTSARKLETALAKAGV